MSLLIEEYFSGPCSLTSESGVQGDFVSNMFCNYTAGGCTSGGMTNHYIIKDTSIYYGASGASCKIYPSDVQTSEMWSDIFTSQDEIWISWKERLSSNYNIGEYHKWFLVQMSPTGGYSDPYVGWQSWGGSSGLTLSAEVYSRGAGAIDGDPWGVTSITFPGNTWFGVKMHIKLNTSSGSYDGIWKIWIDTGSGWVLKSEIYQYCDYEDDEHLHLRANTAIKFISIRMGGSRTGDYGSSGIRWFDNILVGTTEADVEGGSPSPSLSPSVSPSQSPSVSPSGSPSKSPSVSPSQSPSASPSPDPYIRFILSGSPNIIATGEDTTAQLTAPTNKTTDFFTTGRIQDNENPCDALALTSGVGDELTTNGDMELDSSWTDVNVPETNERSNVKTHGDTYSRHIVDSTASWAGAKNTPFTSTTNRIYRISGWYYGVSGGTPPVFRVVYTRGIDGMGINVYWLSTVGSWEYFTVDHTETAGGANASVAVINNSGTNAAEFYIDDVSIKEVLNKYTEIEWCIQATEYAETDETYEFRVTKGS